MCVCVFNIYIYIYIYIKLSGFMSCELKGVVTVVRGVVMWRN